MTRTSMGHGKKRGAWDYVAIGIAVLTILAGLGQAAIPKVALEGMGVEPTPALLLFFVLTSLLVALFGVALLYEALVPSERRMMLLWAAIQKIVSVAVLVAGILDDAVAPIVAAVCVWDGICGIVLIAMWMRHRQTSPAPTP